MLESCDVIERCMDCPRSQKKIHFRFRYIHILHHKIDASECTHLWHDPINWNTSDIHVTKEEKNKFTSQYVSSVDCKRCKQQLHVVSKMEQYYENQKIVTSPTKWMLT